MNKVSIFVVGKPNLKHYKNLQLTVQEVDSFEEIFRLPQRLNYQGYALVVSPDVVPTENPALFLPELHSDAAIFYSTKERIYLVNCSNPFFKLFEKIKALGPYMNFKFGDPSLYVEFDFGDVFTREVPDPDVLVLSDDHKVVEEE